MLNSSVNVHCGYVQDLYSGYVAVDQSFLVNLFNTLQKIAVFILSVEWNDFNPEFDKNIGSKFTFKR